jgi:CheY-like chemotaxis protein
MTKILLVEDDKSLREIYGVRLLAEGYDIVSAGDGEEALAMAIKERPQLIVSDVMMPKISGFDMLDILRSTTETKDIKVIMMTALSSEDQRARGESLGADRYLVKSQVGIEDVVRTVHEVLGDAPVAGASATAAFAAPRGPQPLPARPSPAPVQPAAPSALRPPQPQAQPLPQPAPQPHVPPTPPQPFGAQPLTPPQHVPQQPASVQPTSTPPTDSSLPQPTAPFSTARPAGLGDRIIHPLPHNDSSSDIGNLMAKELNDDAPITGGQPPVSQPLPAPSAPPQQQIPTPQPSPPLAPQPNLTFEETPLPRPPQPPTGLDQPPQSQQ